MSALTHLLEAADGNEDIAAVPPDSTPLLEAYSPLCEKAVRRDGTIGLRIIGPGWGSSGFYGRDVLERDIPKIFPPGTQMFWNHATASEEMERPEGDLRNLAAVTISTPIWLESGPKGPGMYADAKPFAGYAEAIDEIGEHIGVSIRGMGRHTNGTAEGKEGRIIQELVMGKSVDFVTVPGAGGGIVKVFESAPNAAKLPAPSVQTFLAEAGRVLSKANEQKLKTALEQLTAVLSLLDSGEGDVASDGEALPAAEAQSNMEADMDLKEAQDALAARDKELTESRAALAKMQEQLLLREARDLVTVALATAELPDVTKIRLQRELAGNPPVKEGKVDEVAFKAAIDTAVNEARAEIAAISGSNGRIVGMGEAAPTDGVATVAESLKRLDAAIGKEA